MNTPKPTFKPIRMSMAQWADHLGRHRAAVMRWCRNAGIPVAKDGLTLRDLLVALNRRPDGRCGACAPSPLDNLCDEWRPVVEVTDDEGLAVALNACIGELPEQEEEE